MAEVEKPSVALTPEMAAAVRKMDGEEAFARIKAAAMKFGLRPEI